MTDALVTPSSALVGGPEPGSASAMACEWEPAMPKRRLNKREMQDYRRGRDAAMAEVARLIGGRVVVVEM